MKKLISVLSLTLVSAAIFAADETIRLDTHPDAVAFVAIKNLNEMIMAPAVSRYIKRQPQLKPLLFQQHQSKIIDLRKIPYGAPNTELIEYQYPSYPVAYHAIENKDVFNMGLDTNVLPDIGIAAYNGDSWETAAGVGVIYKGDKSYGNKFQMNVFFGTNSVQSARLLFDGGQKRWIAAAAVEDNSSVTDIANVTDPYVYLAISKDEDVVGDYYIYRFHANTLNIPNCQQGCYFEYIHLASNPDVIAVTANIRKKIDNSLVNAFMYVVPKVPLFNGNGADLFMGGHSRIYRHMGGSAPVGPNDYESGAGGTLYLATAGFGTRENIVEQENTLERAITVFAITNTRQAAYGGPLYSTDHMVSVRAYSSPIEANQPNTNTRLYAGDHTISSLIQFRKKAISAVFPISVQTAPSTIQNATRYVSVKLATSGDFSSPVVTSTVIDDKDIIFKGYSAFNPSLALDSNMNGVVTGTITGSNQGFPSTYVMRVSAAAILGNHAYITGMGLSAAACSSPQLWGIYSATARDAATGAIYSAAQYMPRIAGSCDYLDWGTGITKISHIR